MTRTSAAVASAAALLGVVVAANYVTSAWGLIPAGFGLMVPAGTYLAGFALALRDLVHDSEGWRWAVAVIGAGCALSWLVGDGRIALASAVAFLLSELLDLAVYAPLRRRRWNTAVAVSNAAGAVVDTVVFLALSGLGLTWANASGQVLVKAVWVTATFLAVAALVRRLARSREQVPA